MYIYVHSTRNHVSVGIFPNMVYGSSYVSSAHLLLLRKWDREQGGKPLATYMYDVHENGFTNYLYRQERKII